MGRTGSLSEEAIYSDAPPRLDLHRTCTECGRVLPAGSKKDALTCSATCRSARSRRRAKAKVRSNRQLTADAGIGTEAIAAMIPSTGGKERVQDILRPIFQAELRPIVRESITEDTLRAIRGMVALTPLMVQKIGEDMEHPDPRIRQKAYSIMARYTLGHAAIVTPPEDRASGNMTVVFGGMERPGAVQVDEDFIDADPAQDGNLEGAGTRECNGCTETKPLDEFVAGSDRCTDCHERLNARAQALLS